MPDNSLNEPTPQQIKRVLQDSILRSYPNPERRGCPGQDVLRSVADRRLPYEDPHWQHITHCSPCYQEFLEYRARVLDRRRNRRRVTVIAGALAAVLLIAAGWFLTVGRAPKVPSETAGGRRETSDTGNALTAVLNMQASPTRGGDGVPGPPSDQQLPRGSITALLIYLPFGSEPGTYKVDVLPESGGKPLATFTGGAEIRDGLTVLQVSPDLSRFGPGKYIFSVSGHGSMRSLCRVVLK